MSWLAAVIHLLRARATLCKCSCCIHVFLLCHVPVTIHVTSCLSIPLEAEWERRKDNESQRCCNSIFVVTGTRVGVKYVFVFDSFQATCLNYIEVTVYLYLIENGVFVFVFFGKSVFDPNRAGSIKG